MKENKIIFQYNIIDDVSELSKAEALLLKTAQAATASAYAPYSKFHVAASVLLDNGQIVSGTNQENASYPVGICAERTLLATIASMFRSAKIEMMAISYFNHFKDMNDKPAAPCGMCRQALLEWEQRQQQTFPILLAGQTGVIFKIHSAGSLLPLSFFDDFLK